SAAELLGCSPDIACYAKLLTGGMIPLAVTLASSSVFDAFYGSSKLDALLHGHSYTAHPAGCAAACVSLKALSDPARNPNLLPDGSQLKELWDPSLVEQISCNPLIQRVLAIGTVFVAELRTDGAGRAQYCQRRVSALGCSDTGGMLVNSIMRWVLSRLK
ncbi:unnamed protein product, partial [Closterium sp. NIES-54]